MKIPARCNRRDCQARRNLSRRPEQYVRHPKCHMPGCPGLMYVDEYRLRRGEHDKAPLCREDCYPYVHRHDSPDCRHYEDHQMSLALRGKVRNSPFQHSEEEPPF